MKTKKKTAAAAPKHRIFTMPFSRVYPLLVHKVERKGRTKAEVDHAIRWLTGYTAAGLRRQLANGTDYETFFAEAPALNRASDLITGTVCGVRVEAIADLVMKRIRQLDKLVDELAKGRPLEKVLRK